jgi:hypothetical protein
VAKKAKQPSFDEVLANLRTYKFDVAPATGVANQVQVSKYGCAAVLKDGGKGAVPLAVIRPGIVVNGEIGHILDKGYQKYVKTATTERPATADHFRSLHRFSEELKQVTGAISHYNEGLGTVSDEYMYDRVKGRNLPEDERPTPAWELPAAK